MKLLDKVKVIKDRPEYNKEGIFAGRVGRIIDAEIRCNEFHVGFVDPRLYDENFVVTEKNMFDLEEDVLMHIKVEDLELVETYNEYDDEYLLNNLPNNDPRWWCKVENGFIYNLLGEKKNKIAYDYDS